MSIFLYRAVVIWLPNPTVTVFLLAIGEAVTIGFLLAARFPKARAWDPVSLVCTGVGSFYFLFVIVDQGLTLAPLWLTSAIQVAGICTQIFSKACLGRSFGLVPANRGIVTKGPYGWVRHPVYLGYLTSHVGFLLASFTWRNAALYTALYFFQGVRMFREERLLRTDPEYDAYMRRVKFRLIPGIF